MFDGTEVLERFECAICLELLYDPVVGKKLRAAKL